MKNIKIYAVKPEKREFYRKKHEEDRQREIKRIQDLERKSGKVPNLEFTTLNLTKL